MISKDINVEKISLLDLVDEITLKHLLVGFCEKFNSCMQIICLDSKNEFRFIKETPNQTIRFQSEICKIYRMNCEHSKLCDDCDLMNVKIFFDSKKPNVRQYYCNPLGMIDIIAPIMLKDDLIGAVITGQRILYSEVASIEQKIYVKYPNCQREFKEAFQKEKEKKQNKICSLNDLEILKNELQSFANLIGSLCDKVENNRLMVKRLEDEKNHRESFFERITHSLSLPIEAALIDTFNLLEETNTKETIHLHEDTKQIFNSLQMFSLLLQNTMHGSESKTIQGEKNFVKKHIATSLKNACEMFKAEAKEKGCDLKVSLRVNKNDFPVDISDLKDMNLIYKKIIYEKFNSFPKEMYRFFIRTQHVYSREINISELVEYCYMSLDETFEVFDAVTKNKIDFDFSKLSKYYLSPIEMNPEIMDLAFKNLIHNAVKYSFETVSNSFRRYVAINCYFDKDNI